MKFALSQPIPRPRDVWYTSRLTKNMKRFCDRIGNLGLSNVSWVKAPLEKEQIFDGLGVNLTKDSGVYFIKSLMLKAKKNLCGRAHGGDQVRG